MKLYYEKDTDPSVLKGKKVVVLGAGSQGQAHALNLKESGVNVTVGVRKGASWDKAKKAELKVALPMDAVKGADIVMFLIPDEHHGKLYLELEPHLKEGTTIAFAHGFSVHFGQVKPRADLNVFMMAPKGPGHLVRSTYAEGAGVPSLLAVHQDPSGVTRDVGLAYGAAIGAARAGIIVTTFKDECETDLFGEQTVLCGVLVYVVLAAYEVLVEAGYEPEMAYFECLHEVKLIADLMYQGGVTSVAYSISTNAKFGMHTTGPALIDEAFKQKMREALKRIQSGEYARNFLLENVAGAPFLGAKAKQLADHPIEKVGAQLRAMMPWLAKGKLVDMKKN